MLKIIEKHTKDFLHFTEFKFLYSLQDSDILIKELQVTSYEIISLRVAFIARVTSYDLLLLHELRVTFCIRVMSSCLLQELRVTFYIRLTSYCLFHELRVTIIARVTSYCLLHELRVTVYCTNYELLFIARVTSYFLHMSYELLFIARITSYILTFSYNKDRDDEVVYDIKVMIKNYSLRSFLIKNLGFAKPRFHVNSI